MKKEKINQKLIAEKLNLSVSTVSKALRGGYSDVNNDTRAKVVSMATKLGYNHGSRSQQAIFDDTQSYMVAVLILRKLHEFQHTDYFAGMTEKCSKLNVSLIMHYVNEDAVMDFHEKDNQPPAMRDGKLSGVILVNHWPQEVVEELASQTSCVSIKYAYPNTKMDIIGVDEALGIEKLVEHLYSLGHHRIGFFGNCSKVVNARTRFSAYVSAITKMGIEFDASSVIDVGIEHLEDKEYHLNGQIDSATNAIKQGVKAWVCASDWVGYLLSRELMDRGYNIPRDVSIVGFDDSENNPLGCPKLTSTSLPSLQIGAEALRRLMNRIRHPASPTLKVLLPCKLSGANLSTAAPPEEDIF